MEKSNEKSWAEKVDPAKADEQAQAATECANKKEALALLEAFNFDILGGVRQIMNSEAP